MLNTVINKLQRVARRFSRVGLDSSRHPAELYYADIYLDEFRERLADRGPRRFWKPAAARGG